MLGVSLTRDEAEWLEAAVRRASENTVVPQAREPLRALARKLRWPDASGPDVEDYGDELDCTHCGGEGLCWDGSDPLGDCPDDPHRCHACGGSGDRADQTIF